jgi:NADH dehydrogenase
MKISILESGNNVLDAMSTYAKEKGAKQLKDLGVNLLMGKHLETYNGKEAILKDGERIQTSALIWTAGVKGNFPDGFTKENLARGNRIMVDEYNRMTGDENVYVVGDAASVTASPHPMLAPVAIQQAKNLAKNLNRDSKEEWKKFKYVDKGTMATIGRSRAVADLKFAHFKGFFAWMAWLFIHLMLLVGFRNRVIVFFNWVWNYFSYDRAIRLIIRPYKGK